MSTSIAAVSTFERARRRAGGGLIPSPVLSQTHTLHASQLHRWFGWCQTNVLHPLVGIQRAHVEIQRARVELYVSSPR